MIRENIPFLDLKGFKVYKELISLEEQKEIVAHLREVVSFAPLFSPKTMFGKQMSVKMTSSGRYGWYSDEKGYRYIEKHPNGQIWPDIPTSVIAVWKTLVSGDRTPDCCLLNYYQENAKMGMHQDNDEADFDWPVVSISLGDDALFRVGNVQKGGKTESVWLNSGDVVFMGNTARLAYHGVDRIKFGSSSLLSNGGRINLTLRVVD